MAYWVAITPSHAEVHWRQSAQLSACFNRNDFNDARQRAVALCDELNVMSSVFLPAAEAVEPGPCPATDRFGRECLRAADHHGERHRSVAGEW